MSGGDPVGYMGVVSVTWLGGSWMGWWGTGICWFGTDAQGHAQLPSTASQDPRQGDLEKVFFLASCPWEVATVLFVRTSMPGLDKKIRIRRTFSQTAFSGSQLSIWSTRFQLGVTLHQLGWKEGGGAELGQGKVTLWGSHDTALASPSVSSEQ